MVHKHTELTFNLTTEKLKDKKQKTNNKNYKRFKKKKKRKEVTGSRNSLALSLIYQPASRASSRPPAWRSTSCRVRGPGVAAPADSSSARAQDRAPSQLCMLSLRSALSSSPSSPPQPPSSNSSACVISKMPFKKKTPECRIQSSATIQKLYRTEHKQLFIQDLLQIMRRPQSETVTMKPLAPRPAPPPHPTPGAERAQAPAEGAARPERAEPSTLLSEKRASTSPLEGYHVRLNRCGQTKGNARLPQ